MFSLSTTSSGYQLHISNTNKAIETYLTCSWWWSFVSLGHSGADEDARSGACLFPGCQGSTQFECFDHLFCCNMFVYGLENEGECFDDSLSSLRMKSLTCWNLKTPIRSLSRIWWTVARVTPSLASWSIWMVSGPMRTEKFWLLMTMTAATQLILMTTEVVRSWKRLCYSEDSQSLFLLTVKTLRRWRWVGGDVDEPRMMLCVNIYLLFNCFPVVNMFRNVFVIYIFKINASFSYILHRIIYTHCKIAHSHKHRLL